MSTDQTLANLVGAIAAPLKIRDGSGSLWRVLALVEG